MVKNKLLNAKLMAMSGEHILQIKKPKVQQKKSEIGRVERVEGVDILPSFSIIILLSVP